MKRTPWGKLLATLLWMTSLSMTTEAVQRITRQPFGHTADGTPVDLFTLANRNGVEVKITNYGGIVVSLKVPDRNKRLADVVLGYDSLEPYLRDNRPYFGAIIGRYANRIAGGRFTLDSREYRLAQNDGPNHLHGGIKGFDKVVWKATPVKGRGAVGVRLTYRSRDGEEGYPGTVTVTVLYRLTDANELRIDYEATTTKKTILNLTHHSYFNLAGAGEGDILGHRLLINADRFTPVDATLIPTGDIRSVKGTPFDFTRPTAIGARIDEKDQQLLFAHGYDHNWVLNKKGATLTLAARVEEPRSGRILEVYTTEPGLQFYSGNFLDGSIIGKGHKTYGPRAGFCLEAQHFPDSPNKPHFPSVILTPGTPYRQTTIYKFSVRSSDAPR